MQNAEEWYIMIFVKLRFYKGDWGLNGFFSAETERVRFWGLVAAVLTLLLGAFNAVLNLLFFEEKIYMYQGGSEGAWTVYYVLCSLAATFFAALYIANKRKSSDLIISVARNENEGMLFKALRLAAGVIFAVGAVMRFVVFLTVKRTSGLPEVVACFMSVGILVLSFYFFTELNRASVSGGIAICGMVGAVAYIADTLEIYSDMSVPIASEYRLFTAVYTVLFLLALVSELRMRVAEPTAYGYIAMVSIASVIGGSTCIGRMVSVIGGKTVSGVELARTVCGIGITVYLISRLLCIAFSQKTDATPAGCDGIPYGQPAVNGEDSENNEANN